MKKLMEKLKQEIVEQVKTDDEPICIFLGGLPGSGKSNLEKQTKIQYPDKEFVVIDADEYRKYHPEFESLRKTPKDAVLETCEIANQIEAELIAHSIECKKSIILVSTLRATDTIRKIIEQKLRPKGYKVGASVIVVPVYESALSSQMRYEEQILDESQIPRFASISFIKNTNQKIVNTIRELDVNNKILDFTRVYKRGKTDKDLPELVYDSSVGDKRFRSTLEALIDTENVEGQKEVTIDKIYTIKKLFEIGKARKATKEELENTSELYEYYSSKIELNRSGLDEK